MQPETNQNPPRTHQESTRITQESTENPAVPCTYSLQRVIFIDSLPAAKSLFLFTLLESSSLVESGSSSQNSMFVSYYFYYPAQDRSITNGRVETCESYYHLKAN